MASCSGFPYNNLPHELKLCVLESLFTETERQTFTVVDDEQSTANFDDFPITITSRLSPCEPGIKVRVKVRKDFRSLFVSKAFLNDSLPIFARRSRIQLLGVVSYRSSSPNAAIKHDSDTLLNMTLIAMLHNAFYIHINSEQEHLLVKARDSFQYFLAPKVTIEVFDPSPRVWSRFKRSSGILTDVFETAAMASYHPQSQRVLTKDEIRALKGDLVFPGTLSGIGAAGHERINEWPCRVFRVVTVKVLERSEPDGENKMKDRRLLLVSTFPRFPLPLVRDSDGSLSSNLLDRFYRFIK